MLRKRYLFLFLLLLAGDQFGAFAVSNARQATVEYSHQVWQADAGLPSNSIQAICQTRDGYLWLGTKGGLVRFDGVRFDIFDKINTPAIKSNDIIALTEDHEGSLWIGTIGGGLTRFKRGSFTSWSSRDGLASDSVFAIGEDAQGVLWLRTDHKLCRFDKTRFQTYNKAEGLSGENVVAMHRKRKGEIWLVTNEGVSLLKDGEFINYNNREVMNKGKVTALYEDQKGTLWIGTDRGLSIMKDGKIVAIAEPQFPKVAVKSFWEDQQGTFWIGTTGKGLFRRVGEKFIAYNTNDGRSPDYIGAIYEDREGSLWLGTYGSGLSRLKPAMFRAVTMREGLSNDFVFSIYEDRQGSVWLGTYGGGLNQYKDGKFTAFTTANGLSGNIVRAILEDRESSLWVGTYMSGLNRIKDGKISVFTKQDGLSDNSIYALHQDRAGTLWIGTEAGLNCWREGKFTTFTTQNNLTQKTVRALFEDRAGNLWIGTFGAGLMKLKDGQFTTYNTKNGFPDDFVRSIEEDQEGNLWIATYGSGVVRYKDGKFVSLTTKQGLYDNLVYQTLDDYHGNIWMSCDRGIFRIRKADADAIAEGKIKMLSCVTYGLSDGLKSTECNGGNQPAGWRMRDGSLWFPTIKGAVWFDPASLSTNAQAPPVKIERMIASGEELSVENPLTLQPEQKQLEISYTALSFLSPEKIHFKYKLEGFDQDWVNAGTRRVAYYPGLPPGEYTFRVTASNDDTNWNTNLAEFRFSLTPPFYQTKLFYGLCFLVLVLAVTSGYRWRERRLRAYQQKLVTLVKEQTRQLQEANDSLQRLAVMDTLTGIANRRRFDEFLSTEWKRAYRYKMPLTVMMIDVDFFKLYNDTFGHQQGDECLKQVASVLVDSFKRSTELVARYGGEEFVVVSYDFTADRAIRLAETLCRRIAALQIPHPASKVASVVTISIGVSTTIPSVYDAQDTIIARADAALYEAKHAGRNRAKANNTESRPAKQLLV